MPLYKGPVGYGRTINLFMNLFLTAFFVTFNLYIAQQHTPGAPIFTPMNFLIELISGYPIAYFVGDALPLVKWGNAISQRVSNKAASFVVRCVVLGLLFATVLTLLFSWIKTIAGLGVEGWLGAWFSTYPISVVGAIVCVMIALPISEALARAISGFDPRKLGATPEQHA